MLKKILILMGCAIGALSSPQTANALEKAFDEVPVSICEKWLSLLDQGQYGQSWENASSYFKSMVTKEQWVAQASAVRASMGELVSRTFNTQTTATSLPGAPDGQYITTAFSTTFKNKASSIETVVLMKDKDGQWRLAGYFIK